MQTSGLGSSFCTSQTPGGKCGEGAEQCWKRARDWVGVRLCAELIRAVIVIPAQVARLEALSPGQSKQERSASRVRDRRQGRKKFLRTLPLKAIKRFAILLSVVRRPRVKHFTDSCKPLWPREQAADGRVPRRTAAHLPSLSPHRAMPCHAG